MSGATQDTVRQVLADQGRLATSAHELAPSDSLYDAGMTSHASVNVMLALEDAFDIEFPDRMLNRNVFETIDAISAALEELTGAEATA